MATVAETIADIVGAPSWDQRVARIRLVPGQHGTDAHPGIFAAVAREVYVPNLAPDFAYVSPVPFFELDHFQESYDAAASLTHGFEAVASTRSDRRC